MKSLGLIETKGLLPAIECADVMLKSADVRLLGRTSVGAGLVAVTVTGDVAAVKAAVDAAKAALLQLDSNALHSSHVIPRPDVEVFEGMFSSALIGSSEEKKHGVETEISGAVESQVIEPEVEERLVTEAKVAESESVESASDVEAVEPVEPNAKAEPVVAESTDAEQEKIASTKRESTTPEVGNVASKKIDSRNIVQSKNELSKVESPKNDSMEPKKNSIEATPELPPTSKVQTTPAATESITKDDGKHSDNASAKPEAALPSAGQKTPAFKPEKVIAPAKSKGATMRKKDVDALWTEQGAEGVAAGLTKLTLAKLRILAREYSDLPIEPKKLSKVKKRTLVEVFKRYYASLK